MKKKWMFLSVCLSLSLLTACAAEQEVPATTTESEVPTDDSAVVVDDSPWFTTLRIVSGAETGQLVLAETGEAGSGVYTLSLVDEMEQTEFPYQNGQLVNVYYDSFAESWPMQFGGEVRMEPVEGGFDNRCALYLDVLEDLWEVDSGLNGGIEVIGVDLTQTSLNPAERSAVAWVFAGNHGAEAVEGTWEELVEQAYITAEPISSTGSGEDLNDPKYYFYHWENGCLFSITEQPMEGIYSLVPVTFDAQKWRSSLGAYFFMDCTAVQSALGEWSEYHIGAEAIS